LGCPQLIHSNSQLIQTGILGLAIQKSTTLCWQGLQAKSSGGKKKNRKNWEICVEKGYFVGIYGN